MPIVALLSVHPSRRGDLREPDQVTVNGNGTAFEYRDGFGNICTRLVAPTGHAAAHEFHPHSRLRRSPDPVSLDAREVPVEELPPETLRFLMASRFCEVDLLSPVAAELFGHAPRDGAG